MYQALYRKWRPRTFSDVSGQPQVTRTLAHELVSGRISHAYLFTGSRGTGKTTCAKILAKAVNCLTPVDGNPCCECEICRGIDSGAILDVIEIDAASNNGVDNIRDLREEAAFTPVRAKYRVYIIDEVHMLSTGAFNALLKILEEPPSYVIFILATTEVHKLPATILSRCQRFDFKHIPPDDIAARLRFVAEKEGMTLTDEAAVLIARISDGALRDALSLLDRCAARGEEITDSLVGECAGIAGRDYLFRLAEYVSRRDTCSAITLLNELHNESCAMDRLCSELMNHFRNLMVVKTVRNAENLIVCSQNELEELKKQSADFTLESILYSLSVLENTSFNLKKGLDRRTEVEMAVIRLCDASLSQDTQAILKRLSDIELSLKNIASSPLPTGQRLDNYSAAPTAAPVSAVAPIRSNEMISSPMSNSPVAAAEKGTLSDTPELPPPIGDSDAPADIPSVASPVAASSRTTAQPVDATVDTAADTTVDKAVDIPVNLSVDATVDTAVNTSVDTTVDTAADTTVGAPADARTVTPAAASASSVNAAPAVEQAVREELFRLWPEVLTALKKLSMPLFGVLTNSSAYVRGDVLRVKSQNAAFEQFMNIPTYSSALSDAIIKTTGKKYSVQLYKKDEQDEDVSDPLFNLVKKINLL